MRGESVQRDRVQGIGRDAQVHGREAQEEGDREEVQEEVADVEDHGRRPRQGGKEGDPASGDAFPEAHEMGGVRSLVGEGMPEKEDR